MSDVPTADDLSELASLPNAVRRVRTEVVDAAIAGRFRSTDSGSERRRRRLSDVVTFQNGFAFKSEWYESAGVALVRCQNIGHGALDWSQAKYISAERARTYDSLALAIGDIVLALDRPLISTGLKVARIGPDDVPCLLLQRVARLKTDEAELSADYLWLWLHSTSFLRSINPGRSNGVPHISTRELAALEIEYPSRAEQASVVEDFEWLAQLIEQVRVERESLEQERDRLAEVLSREMVSGTPSRTLEMLPDILVTAKQARVLQTAFARRYVSEMAIKSGSANVRVGDIASFTNGRAFKSSDWLESGLPIVRIQNLTNAHNPYNHADPATVDSKHRIETGSVLLSWSGTPGTSFGVHIWDRGPAALNQHIFKCEIDPSVTREWFRIAVNVRIGEVLDEARGGVGLKHLTKRQIDDLTIPLPSLWEQEAAARDFGRIEGLYRRVELELRS